MSTPTRAALTREGSIARITLRSERGENRIGAETIADLTGACQGLNGDQEIRVVVVAAEGTTFSTGWSQELLVGASGGEHMLLPGSPRSTATATAAPWNSRSPAIFESRVRTPGSPSPKAGSG
jgi:enoyl-CoA hydratase/carnithine racemase